MDPKLRKLLEYLRAGYRPAAAPVTVDQVPRMSSADYRTGEFIRSAPAHLPKSPTQALLSLLAPTGTRSGLATRMSTTPVED